MAAWEDMLDEFALHPDPMTWYQVKGLRISIAEQFEAVNHLFERGFVRWAGVIRDEWKDSLYAITDQGMAYWEEHLKGKRKRPGTADPVPRYSLAKRTAAVSPVDVFDLPRAPWIWRKR